MASSLTASCSYITVDEEAGRALFYLFVESRNSDSDPVTLWLNGGTPACLQPLFCTLHLSQSFTVRLPC